MPLADGSDTPDQHPARAGDGVLHLAPRPHDLQHLRAEIAPGGLQLAERGRVDVEVLDVDEQLVFAQRQERIDDLGLLRQHAGRPDHAPQPVRIQRHGAFAGRSSFFITCFKSSQTLPFSPGLLKR